VIEGYTANGELLSGAVSAAGLAMAVSSWSKARRLRWFFGSGVLFGLALSVKQSGFDGLGAICAWLIVGSIVVRSRRREALRAVGATIAGMVCVVGVLMIEGAIAGWSRWWNAVVGYRLGQQSGFSAEWANLITTLRPALAVLGPTAVAALVGVVLVFTPSHPSTTSSLGRRALVLPLWALTSVSAFLIGGGFWRHYWVLLAAPLSALAGVALSRAGRAKPIAFGALVVPCLTITVWAFAGDGDTLTVRTADYRRAPVNVRVADWFLSHRREGDTLYVLCNSPAVYAMAHQDPGYPYLYLLEVRNAPRGRELLVSYLSDPARAPRYIASYEKPSKCDPSGRVKRILSEDYHPAGKISFVTMYRRNDDSAPRRLPHR
jgi:hypothetical protein